MTPTPSILLTTLLLISWTAASIDSTEDASMNTPRELSGLIDGPKVDNSMFKFPRKLKKKMITHECILGARIYPFKYVGATQTMELKMELKSNCMEFSTLNFFVLPFNSKMKLTKVIHPKRVIISIYQRVYQLDYSKGKKRGSGKLFSIDYESVRIIPSKLTRPTRIVADNNILLRTTAQNPFTKPEMDRLLVEKNPILCKLSKDKRIMYCQI